MLPTMTVPDLCDEAVIASTTVPDPTTGNLVTVVLAPLSMAAG
jgi:hypothetical protein